jgi:hypothetical protein
MRMRGSMVVMVVMSHIHVNDHVYMEIRLIRLISIRSKGFILQCCRGPRHGPELRHSARAGIGWINWRDSSPLLTT